MNTLATFIGKRSQREILLFKLLWIIGLFYVCFEYFAYPYFLNFQAHKHSLQSLHNSQEVEEALIQFNQTSIPYTKLLSLLQSKAQTFTKIQSSNEKNNYEISLQGIGNPDLFFPLLHSISSPSLLIISFSLHSNGEFYLNLKDQKILHLQPASPINLSLKQILQKFQLTYTPNAFSFYTLPKPEPSLNLEAILNNKAKINGVWLRSGGEIKGHILQKITPHSVTLSKENRSIKLYLKEKRILQ